MQRAFVLACAKVRARVLTALKTLPEAGGAECARHGERRHGWVKVNIIKTDKPNHGADCRVDQPQDPEVKRAASETRG